MTTDKLLVEIDTIDKELVKLGDGNLNDALQAVRRIRKLVIADRERMIKAIEALEPAHTIKYDNFTKSVECITRQEAIAIIKGEEE